MMKLLVEVLKQQLPNEAEGKDPIVWVKYHIPELYWSWYGVSFDGEDRLMGIAVGPLIEAGNFSLKRLQKFIDELGLPITQDLSFKPCRFSQVMKEVYS